MASTIKMLVAMGMDKDDKDIAREEDDALSSGDVSSAFLQADGYGAADMSRIVGYKAHRTRVLSCDCFSY